MRGSAAFRTGVTPGGALAGPWVRNPLWNAAKAVPSLDLRFADNKSLVDATTGSQLVTFTRASSGTFVDSDGVLQTATTNAPRFDHNPTTGESLGLLVEEQRTNLLLRSSEISGSAPWGTQGTAPTITANAFASPDGNTTATRVTFITGDSRITQGTIPVTNGTTYTFSLYARPVTVGTLNKIRLACFDSVSQNNSNDITLVAGWQRISFTFTSTGTGNATINIRNEVSGLIANDVYIWGAQLEIGAFPTSYIATAGATATRSADLASITGANFSSWYSSTAGTMYSQWITPVIGSRSFQCEDAARANLERFAQRITSNLIVTEVTSNGVAVNESNGSAGVVTYGLTLKTCAAFDTGNVYVTFKGITESTVLANGGPECGEMMIGSFRGTATFANGPIARLTFWPTRLPNSTLQVLTQ